MTNILVTGGAGYIGSHTCKALARAGFTPVTYDNLIYGHEWAVKWGPFIKGDIFDSPCLADTISTYCPSAVIHFAGFGYVGESVQDPAKYYRNNVAGTINLLDVMRRCGVGDIVFSSTCATYGIPDDLPISEDTPQQPINPYGSSKLMVERMLGEFGTAYGLKSISLRYFNAAGADPEGEAGEDHEPEAHLIPLALEVAAGRRSHIMVFGDDYDTPDGTCIRDYIHVSDLAEAHVLAVKGLQLGGLRPAYNLGSRQGYSVAEIIQTARDVTGCNISAISGPRRPGDPANLVADFKRARDELGWTPHYPDISQMVETAWRWYIASVQCTREERDVGPTCAA